MSRMRVEERAAGSARLLHNEVKIDSLYAMAEMCGRNVGGIVKFGVCRRTCVKRYCAADACLIISV